MESRERLSTQTAWPRAERLWRGSGIVGSFEDGTRATGDVVGGEAEVLEDGGARARSAEAVDADDVAPVADPLPPTHAGPGLDGQARRHGAGDDRLAVGLVLGLEQLHAGNRDHADGPALAGQRPPRGQGRPELRAGGHENDLRVAARLPE